jgi:hypothetical protein
MDQNGCRCQGSEGKVAGVRHVTRGPKRAPSGQRFYGATLVAAEPRLQHVSIIQWRAKARNRFFVSHPYR